MVWGRGIHIETRRCDEPGEGCEIAILSRHCPLEHPQAVGPWGRTRARVLPVDQHRTSVGLGDQVARCQIAVRETEVKWEFHEVGEIEPDARQQVGAVHACQGERIVIESPEVVCEVILPRGREIPAEPREERIRSVLGDGDARDVAGESTKRRPWVGERTLGCDVLLHEVRHRVEHSVRNDVGNRHAPPLRAAVIAQASTAYSSAGVE